MRHSVSVVPPGTRGVGARVPDIARQVLDTSMRQILGSFTTLLSSSSLPSSLELSDTKVYEP